MIAPSTLRRFGVFRIFMAFGVAMCGAQLQSQTVISGPYNAQTITGDVSIATSTSATFTGGTTFTGANATVGNYATLNWNQNGTLAGKAVTLGTSAGAS